jgi:hypothetical protein
MMALMLQTILGPRSSAKKELDCSSVLIAYPSKNGKWRGFVQPYDITFEADSKTKVVKALKDMAETYEDMLKEYDYPEHLRSKPFSNEEDSSVFTKIAVEALTERGKFDGKGFYAEAISN